MRRGTPGRRGGAGAASLLLCSRRNSSGLLLPAAGWGPVSWFIPVDENRAVKNPDRPLPFGPRVAWLAVDSTDTEAVAKTLGLREVRDVNCRRESRRPINRPSSSRRRWRTGRWRSAPQGSFRLLTGSRGFVKPLLERLSRQFGMSGYFCTQHDIELHAWGEARKGRLVPEAMVGLVRRALPSGMKGAGQRREER